ncbi:hypothetical protein [Flexithrix dorotheae]|uniref:hypothetical protein n=1 Tax=Flexithrix dorotheae TaxID=70993 RepID=UPI0005C5A538|nr:hypothetical protein [Flexithrix dorotheae]
MRLQPTCMACGKQLSGRIDKKFCDAHCKSSFHYQKARNNPSSFFNRVDNQLKLNRRVLKSYNKAGKATVRKQVLIEKSFNPKFFTHYWKNKKGDVYLFCYEFGFLEKLENGKAKYILVQWQGYMEL